LQHLELSDNSLSGEIPHDIGKLKSPFGAQDRKTGYDKTIIS